MKQIFENTHTEIYDIREEVPHTVFAYWKGHLSLKKEEAKIACQASLDLFKELGIKVMISDHKYLEGATVEFLDWLHDYYFPTCVQNGLKAEILLASDEDMGNVTLDLMYDEDDFHKKISQGELYTPKADNLENAKRLAMKILEEEANPH